MPSPTGSSPPSRAARSAPTVRTCTRPRSKTSSATSARWSTWRPRWAGSAVTIRMADLNVLVAGDAAITFAWQLNAPPVPGRTSKLLGPVDPPGRFGGCAPSVALALAGFGHRVALVSWLGDDAYGRAYLEELRAHGVDTGGVMVATGQSSPRALMLYDPSGAATCLHHPSGSSSLQLSPKGRERLERSGWLALTAGPPAMSEALLDSRVSDTRVAWDVKADPNHYPVPL